MQEWEERVQLRLLLNTSTHFPSVSSFLPLLCHTTPLFHVHSYIATQIGWHRIRGSWHDLQQPKLVMVGNIIYPCIVFLLLAFACVSQILICFFRDQVCHSLHLQCHLSPPHLSTSTLPLSHPLSQQVAGVFSYTAQDMWKIVKTSSFGV